MSNGEKLIAKVAEAIQSAAPGPADWFHLEEDETEQAYRRMAEAAIQVMAEKPECAPDTP